MISARIIADSTYINDITNKQHRVTTFELEYPRYIHSELKTHRVFSSNSASSRAIPVERMIELTANNPVMPMWTLNQKGMSGNFVEDPDKKELCDAIWLDALNNALNSARSLAEAGIHKQNVNRLLEPFQHIKTILTGTEWDNFFNLRISPEAQPEIHKLAARMQDAILESTPNLLGKHEVHCPYFPDPVDYQDTRSMLTSVALCAQVSYRREDDSDDTTARIINRLLSSDRIHASPFEHVCMPNFVGFEPRGNLKGYIQLRHKIEELKPRIDEWKKEDNSINYYQGFLRMGGAIWL